jgi:hypothetical protein
VQVPLEAVDGEACIRIGDVYALAVETYARMLEWPQALRMAQDMAARGIHVMPYLDATLLTSVYENNGLPVPGMGGETLERRSSDASVVSDVDF